MKTNTIILIIIYTLIIITDAIIIISVITDYIIIKGKKNLSDNSNISKSH